MPFVAHKVKEETWWEGPWKVTSWRCFWWCQPMRLAAQLMFVPMTLGGSSRWQLIFTPNHQSTSSMPVSVTTTYRYFLGFHVELESNQRFSKCWPLHAKTTLSLSTLLLCANELQGMQCQFPVLISVFVCAYRYRTYSICILYTCIYLSIIYLSVCVFINLCIYLSVCLSVCLSAHLSL